MKTIKKLIQASRYSFDGLSAAVEGEFAVRLEIFLGALLIPLGLFLGKTGVERALLLGSLLLVFIVELLNSAIESTVDRISLEEHPLAKKAKDMGSAAVFIAVVNVFILWGCVLFG